MIDYPLLLQPQYDEKIWGDRRLERVLGKRLPPNAAIGESLESGDNATVAAGPLRGRTLQELAASYPVGLLGERGAAVSAAFNDFPLLVKFIDASSTLSLQVHPDDEGAVGLGKRGKTEAWVIIAADPGAELITGLSAQTAANDVRPAIESGQFETLLERQEVQPGDSFMVPAGTVHAIGAGVLLYEVQQNSDVTFRLYDWGRVDQSGRPRELHLDQALQALRPDRRATLTQPLPLDDRRAVLAACRYFSLERWRIKGVQRIPSSVGATFRLLSVIQGEVSLQLGDSILRLSCGETALLPAAMPELWAEGSATLLCSGIPDLATDVVEPLLAAGHSHQLIERLDGGTGHLGPLLASTAHNGD